MSTTTAFGRSVERTPSAPLSTSSTSGVSGSIVITTEHRRATSAGDVAADQTYFLSTEGMMRHARESDKDTMIVATETGIITPANACRNGIASV